MTTTPRIDIRSRVRFDHHGIKYTGRIIGQVPGSRFGYWVIKADHDGCWYEKSKTGSFELL